MTLRKEMAAAVPRHRVPWTGRATWINRMRGVGGLPSMAGIPWTAGAAAWMAGGVCPAAPEGVQVYADQMLSWVKWAVLTVLGLCLIGSVGMLIWGRVTHHPRGARLGFDGVLICLVGAVAYVVLPPIVGSITGSGC